MNEKRLRRVGWFGPAALLAVSLVGAWPTIGQVPIQQMRRPVPQMRRPVPQMVRPVPQAITTVPQATTTVPLPGAAPGPRFVRPMPYRAGVRYHRRYRRSYVTSRRYRLRHRTVY